jgi:YjbE family integral membrane protein
VEILSMEFLAALAAIVVIDLVLAGDNAIVIALAARNLKPALRKQAIIWGTFGAIAMRAAMTVIVVWLLKIPGLMLFGGVMLLWIAYRLLVPSEGSGGHEVKAADGFWAAMGTIVIADVMMGLDNVLAVAGAAHGSYLLVVLGLLISIPIVVWGSQLVLKLIDRFPGIVYLGAAVLLLTAAKMITDEPLIKEAIGAEQSLKTLVYAVLVAGILALAFLRNGFRKQDQLEARLFELATRTQPRSEGRQRVLLPASGSARTLETVQRLLDERMPGRDLEVHLLHVRSPMGGVGASLVNRRNVALWQQEQGMKKLAPAVRLLAERGIPHVCHVRVGDRANAIAALAQEAAYDRVIIPSARKNSLTRLLDDWYTGRVIERTELPVEAIPTRQSGDLERVLVPASMGALALLVTFALA